MICQTEIETLQQLKKECKVGDPTQLFHLLPINLPGTHFDDQPESPK
jgi:hypothetical protein